MENAAKDSKYRDILYSMLKTLDKQIASSEASLAAIKQASSSISEILEMESNPLLEIITDHETDSDNTKLLENNIPKRKLNVEVKEPSETLAKIIEAKNEEKEKSEQKTLLPSGNEVRVLSVDHIHPSGHIYARVLEEESNLTASVKISKAVQKEFLECEEANDILYIPLNENQMKDATWDFADSDPNKED